MLFMDPSEGEVSIIFKAAYLFSSQVDRLRTL